MVRTCDICAVSLHFRWIRQWHVCIPDDGCRLTPVHQYSAGYNIVTPKLMSVFIRYRPEEPFSGWEPPHWWFRESNIWIIMFLYVILLGWKTTNKRISNHAWTRHLLPPLSHRIKMTKPAEFIDMARRIMMVVQGVGSAMLPSFPVDGGQNKTKLYI